MSEHQAAPVLMATETELDRLIHCSLVASKERLDQHKAALLAQHGCNDVRAFFMFAGVMRTDLGSWLMLRLRMLPYDEWNTVYLPTSEIMARTLGLPLHPQRDLDEFDSPIAQLVTTVRQNLEQACAPLYAEKDNDLIPETIVKYRQLARQGIVEYARRLRPVMIEHIGSSQRS